MSYQTKSEDTPCLLRSRHEARAMLGGIGQTTLDTLLKEGQLRRVKIGRRAMVEDESIRRFINKKATS